MLTLMATYHSPKNGKTERKMMYFKKRSFFLSFGCTLKLGKTLV
jgi:hypothetical protein